MRDYSIWDDLQRILIKRRGIQRVLNHRYPFKATRIEQRALIIKQEDEQYWNDLLVKYGGMGDEELRERLKLIEQEIDFEMDKVFKHH